MNIYGMGIYGLIIDPSLFSGLGACKDYIALFKANIRIQWDVLGFSLAPFKLAEGPHRYSR